MIELGAQVQYIIAAYCGVGLVTLGLIGWTFWDSRAQQKRLGDLEARGIRRRSAATTLKGDGAA